MPCVSASPLSIAKTWALKERKRRHAQKLGLRGRLQERHREGQTKRDRKLEKIRDTGDEKGKQ